MKLISTDKPWSFLWAIVIQLAMDAVVIVGAIIVDVIYISNAPPLEQPGFRFPVATMGAMLVMAAITALVVLVTMVTILVLSILKHRKP